MTAGDLLRVEPEELQFPFELKKQISCSLQLCNMTDDYIAFKGQGTQIERRWTKMHQGYLALWINRAEYVQHEQQPRTDYNQYMTWYRNITCRFITEARPINQVPSLEHPPSVPDVSHEDQVEKVMEYIAKAVPVAKKAATGGLKFTKKIFKMLANHYLETCRLSLDALGQLSVYEEYVRRAEWDIAHERQRRERRTKRRHPEMFVNKVLLCVIATGKA